jgi:hypothetical protein
MLITYELLCKHSACEDQRKEFHRIWPHGMMPTQDNLRLCHDSDLEAFWLLRLLPPKCIVAFARWCAARADRDAEAAAEAAARAADWAAEAARYARAAWAADAAARAADWAAEAARYARAAEAASDADWAAAWDAEIRAQLRWLSRALSVADEPRGEQ